MPPYVLGQREAQMAGRVGEVLRPPQQRLPFVARQAAMFEIGARPFAPMVEEADVVVGLFERLDLRVDERIELGEIVEEAAGQIEVHIRVRWQGYSSDFLLPPASPPLFAIAAR